ncbi:hypothetical protein B0H13DRAFT_2664158, partial [Mycena leptocephala]
MTHRTSVPSAATPHPYTTARCHPATRHVRVFAPTYQPHTAPKQAAHALVPYDSQQCASQTYAPSGTSRLSSCRPAMHYPARTCHDSSATKPHPAAA